MARQATMNEYDVIRVSTSFRCALNTGRTLVSALSQILAGTKQVNCAGLSPGLGSHPFKPSQSLWFGFGFLIDRSLPIRYCFKFLAWVGVKHESMSEFIRDSCDPLSEGPKVHDDSISLYYGLLLLSSFFLLLTDIAKYG